MYLFTHLPKATLYFQNTVKLLTEIIFSNLNQPVFQEVKFTILKFIFKHNHF